MRVAQRPAAPLTHEVPVEAIALSNKKPIALIAGPCVIENVELTLSMARDLSNLARRHKMAYVFKASYDKANRSSVGSFRGPGLQKGLRVLQRVRDEIGCPILTDVHWTADVK